MPSIFLLMTINLSRVIEKVLDISTDLKAQHLGIQHCWSCQYKLALSFLEVHDVPKQLLLWH